MTRLLRIILILVVVAAVVAANVVRRHATVAGVEVVINYDGCDTLETAGQIMAILAQQMPQLTTIRVKDVDTKAVTAVVEQSPFLHHVRTSVGMTGRVKIYAQQRRPILRVYCGNDRFYIDEEGTTLPLSSTGRCDVPLATGYFQQRLADPQGNVDLSAWVNDSTHRHYTLTQLWRLTDHLYRDNNRLAQYDQIYINAKGDFCLVPNWADFTVVVGSADNLEEKMRHLDRFVERVIPVKGWNAYSEVSLKYKRQIVCRKKQ